MKNFFLKLKENIVEKIKKYCKIDEINYKKREPVYQTDQDNDWVMWDGCGGDDCGYDCRGRRGCRGYDCRGCIGCDCNFIKVEKKND